jgi:hypothetical protein
MECAKKSEGLNIGRTATGLPFPLSQAETDGALCESLNLSSDLIPRIREIRERLAVVQARTRHIGRGPSTRGNSI